MLLASLIALAGAVFVGTPEEIEKKMQEVRAEAARQARAMQQQKSATASDKTRPAVLNGAALLATCPDEAFLSITAMPVATPTGGGAVVFPEFYTLAVAGRPALKYYFKNASGRQLEMLFLLDGQMRQTHYTLQYWSQGDGGQKAMTGARRLATLVLP